MITYSWFDYVVQEVCPTIKNILLLDSEGKRVAVKYYSNDWPTNSAKLAFEKSVFTKTQKTNARTEGIQMLVPSLSCLSSVKYHDLNVPDLIIVPDWSRDFLVRTTHDSPMIFTICACHSLMFMAYVIVRANWNVKCFY